MYDDCDEVRRKLRAFLRTNRMKQTHLLKLLGLNHKSYSTFMSYKGKLKGSGNSTYPAAYRFLENLRIHEGKPKSQHRLGAEQIFTQGRSLVTHSDKVRVRKGEIPTLDEWGRICVVSADGRSMRTEGHSEMVKL